jgi:hypothetical protein
MRAIRAGEALGLIEDMLYEIEEPIERSPLVKPFLRIREVSIVPEERKRAEKISVLINAHDLELKTQTTAQIKARKI